MIKIWCDLCGKEIVDDKTHMIKKIYRMDNGKMVQVMNEEWDQCLDCTILMNDYMKSRKEQLKVRE